MSCYAGCAKRRKPSTNIVIGGRKLKDVIEVSSCLSGQCKPPYPGLGGTSIVKLSSKPRLPLSWPQHEVRRLGPWRGSVGLALTLHHSSWQLLSARPASAGSGLCQYAYKSAGPGSSDIHLTAGWLPAESRGEATGSCSGLPVQMHAHVSSLHPNLSPACLQHSADGGATCSIKLKTVAPACRSHL